MEKQCQQLSPNEQEILINLLRKLEDFFDETLSTRKTAPVELELKYDAAPVCSRPYPVPRVHTPMFRKEVEILVKLGVLKEASDS